MKQVNNIFLILIVGLICLSSCGDNSTSKEIKKTGNAALDQLNVLIKKDSLDHVLYFERAKLYYENGYYDGAIEDLELAIKIDSLQADYYHLLSDSYLDYLKSKEALITMDRCISTFPERIPSLLKMSEIQLILKQYDNSLQTCSNILTINPNNAEAYFMMGMNLRSIDEIDRAKTAFRKATEIDPELTDAWIILGQLFEDEQNPIALEYYDAAINVDRDNPTSWHSKAYYLQNNGQIEEAIEIYQSIISIDKDYLDAYLNSGILYMSMDSMQRAYESFNLMCKVKPQLYLSYYYRGLANEALNKLDAAKEDYNTCIKLNINFSKASKALSLLEEKMSEETN